MANYRNPNGYGGITKMSGRRRKPFVVRKTVGYDDRAYPIYSVLGYYETRKDAMLALAEYNRNPYDIDRAKITFKELYDLWSDEAYQKMKQSLQGCYKAAYKHCVSVYDIPYRELRKRQMQACIDDCGRGYSTRQNIKLLFSQMDKYAFDRDIIAKQYSTNLDIGEKEESTKHTIFTDAEVSTLWAHVGEPYVDEALFLLYTGMRVSEMLKLLPFDVYLEQGYLIGGMKTKNGKNRIIPIHPDIKKLVADHVENSHGYLFDLSPTQNTHAFTTSYIQRWTDALKVYGINHLTHDCRHTVRSKLDSAGANKVAIDRIMGHSSQSIGEKVYTHKTLDELKEAMYKLVYVRVR